MRCLPILLTMVTILPLPAVAAPVPPNCALGEAPSFGHGFGDLHELLGAAMGNPIECEHPEPATGDAYQQTTTGIAIYHKDRNMAMFTDGHEHWALTDGGLVHWSGWHGNAGPLGTAPPADIENEQLKPASAVTYPKVEAVTIVQALDDDGWRLIVHHAGTAYLVETAGGCGDGQPLDGRLAFTVSPAAFAGPGSRLMLTLGGKECPIVDSYPL